MKYCRAPLLCLGLIAATPVFGDEVVINEIMYHPSSGSLAEEYVELFNCGTNIVDLSGWRFSQGVTYVIPPGTQLAPGGYLVVAADVAVFSSKYPGVTGVVGGWIGELSNAGEDVQLENAAGENIDTVPYADSGDWAVRERGPFDDGHQGWVWEALHDGGGSSVELINPALSNDHGQNWAASQVVQGTPGALNSTTSANIAPMILNVAHFPPVPGPADSVTVTARILDETSGPLTVRLFHRTFSNPFQQVTMADNGQQGDGVAGDGIFGAVLPAQTAGTVVEFYLSASDGPRSRTWPAPALDDFGSPIQQANLHYQVDTEPFDGRMPMYRLVMTESERNELTSNTIRDTDAQMNATFIVTDGVDTEIRYNTGVRIRGAGSRGSGNPVPNYRVNIPSDRRWNDIDGLNLNSRFTYSQIAGSLISLKAGLPAASARAVQVRVNGANFAQSGAPQYGFYAHLEPYSSDWADNHLPADSGGNVYRGSTGAHSATLNYLGNNFVSYINAGYGKESNQGENDWTDLFALTEALSSLADDEPYADAVRQVANIQMWMRYFAVFSMLNSFETSLATGRGDDWAAYRGLIDTRFILLPHDFDSILGEGGGNLNDNIFRMCPAVNGGANTAVLNRFMRHPEFVRIYFEELQRLADTVFSPEQMNPLLDRALGGLVPAQTISNMKQFAADRRQAVLNQMPRQLVINANAPLSNGYPRTTSPSVILFGFANATKAASVLVNGSRAAFTPWQGLWRYTNSNLVPGINRILVQSLAPNVAEVERGYIDVWYDDSTVEIVNSDIVSDAFFNAAAGPYLIQGAVQVEVGRTLTIQPGTTVYFGPNGSLNVGGRLIAAGTETSRIRLTRQPGTAGNWAGLHFNFTQESNRLSYVDMEFANGADPITLNNARLDIDHVTWTGTTRTVIDINNSSLSVRNSVFPTITDNETIHGTAMPPGGYVIIADNYFGGTTGYSDIIDFSGGRRPGPILQVYDNVFNGGSDDVLDLDATDAHIEGNVFMNVHQDAPRDSGSYAIATDEQADLTVVRNIFFNLDHALLLKNGSGAVFHNNTVLGVSTNNASSYAAAVVSFGEPDRGVSGGAGADLDGNIFWDVDRDRHFLYFTNAAMSLNVRRSILSGTNHPGLGNLDLDPRFAIANTNLITAANIREALALRPISPGLNAGPNGLDMGALVPAGASLSGEPLSPTASSSATLTVAGPGISHYRSSLNGGPFGTETSVAVPITLSGLADGEYKVSVIGKNSAGVWQPESEATSSAAWIVNTAFSRLVINEVLALNRTAVGHEDTLPDIVELHYRGAAPLDLGGMGITDSTNAPYQFVFPAGTVMNGGDYLVLYADDETTTSGLHLGFALNQNGDGVFLYAPSGQGGALVDSVTFGRQAPDLSIGRLGHGEWGLTVPTFGSANMRQPLGDVYRLKINEWGASGISAFADDFVELYNPDTLPVALGGLYLTDELLGLPGRFQIEPLTFLAGQTHLLYVADGDEDAGSDHLNFRLPAEQGEIGLLDAGLNVIDCVFYGPQTTDVSEGRRPSGSATFDFFGPLTMTQPTPGAPNPGLAGSITISNIIMEIFPLATDWRYERNGVDLGTSWRNPSFNDAGWQLGQALLGVESSGLPAPGLVTFFPNYSTTQVPYYFRKQFFMPTNPAGYDLGLNVVLDDGAILYLNGTELTRIRMSPGPVNAFTLPNTTVDNASAEFLTLPGNLLTQGNNTLAVEVHNNANPTSSDIIWGMGLALTRTVTNFTEIRVVLNEVMANNLSFTVDGDTNITDWVELLNPGGASVNLAGMSLTDNSTEPQRWVVPPGVVLGAGERMLIHFDSSRPASTEAGGVLNTGFGLGAGGDNVFLFDKASQGGVLMDAISFGIQAADFSIGRLPDGSGSWALNLPTPGSENLVASLGNSANLLFNEWLANPSGNDDDFFEIYNPNPQPVELGGFYVTDDLTDPTKFRIPALSFVGTGLNGFALFIADSDPEDGPDHVDFGLSGGGESLGLYTPAAALVTSVNFGDQDNGISEGRFPDGSAVIARFPGTDTPGASNIRPLTEIIISEALTHSDPPFEDAIELKNVSDGSVDLSGWFLSDRRDDPKKFRIPDGTLLAPGEHAVFYEYQFNPDPGVAPSFALSSAEGEDLYLSTADLEGNLTGFRTDVDFGPAANGVSFGHYETSVDIEFVAQESRTFGVDNPATLEAFREGTGLDNSAPRVGPVVVSEIQYHPPDINGTNDNSLEEFVELHNITGSPVLLYDPAFPTNHWRLRDAVRFEFEEGDQIPAGGYLVVVSFDPLTNATALAEFRAAYGLGAGVPIVGPYGGELNNSDDSVELVRPDAPQAAGLPDAGMVPFIMVDQIQYRDEGPWPARADGFGPSLHRRNDAEFGNDPVNWIAANPTPGSGIGTAVLALPSISTPPSDQSAAPGGSVAFNVSASGAGPLFYQWRFRGQDLAGATNATLTLNGVQNDNAGEYRVRIHNGAGAVLSPPADLVVQSPPVIARHPGDLLLAEGATAYFTANVRGAAPLSFQWRKDGISLPGATGNLLVIPDVETGDEGVYSLRVTSPFGTATSDGATLTINQPPVILAEPQDQEAFVGTSAMFQVTATGTPPLRYAWRFNGATLPGETSPSLVLDDLQLADAGSYSVVVQNSIGTATSRDAQLTVQIPPTLSVRAMDDRASEPGVDSGLFVITRAGNTNTGFTIDFSVGGTASSGQDYTAITGPFTFAPGAVTLNIPVLVLNDPALEGNESVLLTLLETENYLVEPPASATVTIFDDDNQAPVVILTSPLPNVLFEYPAAIPLAAAASDADGSVVSVRFVADGTNVLGEVSGPTYALVWTNAAPGVHELTAVATDNLGATGSSAPVHINVNAPPFAAITSPSEGDFFVVPTDIIIEAVAADTGGSVTEVAFYEGENLLGISLAAPHEFTWSDVAPGTYELTVRSTDELGTVSISSPVMVSVLLQAPAFADDFAQAGMLVGYTHQVTGNNSAFTKEPGENNHGGIGSRHSAWISWRAPATSACTVDALGSNFDTIMAVYTGAQVDSLTQVGFNDDADAATLQSRVTFDATEGTVYRVVVDEFGTFGNGGNIEFHLSLARNTPVITSHPQSQSVTPGANVTLNVAATGPGTLAYRWQRNGLNLPGATNPSLILNGVQAKDVGIYTVVVSNANGASTSGPAVIALRSAPVITAHPQSTVAAPGETVTLSVAAAGTAPFSYQWRFNGAPIAQATSASLILQDVGHEDGGFYNVSIVNTVGSTVSIPAELIVRPSVVQMNWPGDGTFRFVYHATPGSRYAVDATIDFVDWEEITNILHQAVAAEVIDGDTSDGTHKFYRLRLVP